MCRSRSVMLALGCVMALTQISWNALEATPSNSENAPEEVRLAIAYPVNNLAVWQIRDGKPHFDASVVIAYLRKFVDADALIDSTAEHDGLLVVSGSRGDHTIIHRAMLPLWAFAGDVDKLLEEKIAEAKMTSQKVLVFASDPNSEAARMFFDLQVAEDQPAWDKAIENYRVQCIAVQQSEILKRLGIASPSVQGAAIAVLDSDGTVEAQMHLSGTEASVEDIVGTMVEFLRLNQPTFTDARNELASGYERAEREQKRVLLVYSGPNCGPCVELFQFLTAKKELLEKDYVVIKLDSRMAHAIDTIKNIRTAGRGIPWMAVLDAKGNVLMSGDGPNGNIGYPSSEQDRIYFHNMLRETSQRLSEDEIATIVKALEEEAE